MMLYHYAQHLQLKKKVMQDMHWIYSVHLANLQMKGF